MEKSRDGATLQLSPESKGLDWVGILAERIRKCGRLKISVDFRGAGVLGANRAVQT